MVQKRIAEEEGIPKNHEIAKIEEAIQKIRWSLEEVQHSRKRLEWLILSASRIAEGQRGPFPKQDNRPVILAIARGEDTAVISREGTPEYISVTRACVWCGKTHTETAFGPFLCADAFWEEVEKDAAEWTCACIK